MIQKEYVTPEIEVEHFDDVWTQSMTQASADYDPTKDLGQEVGDGYWQ